MMNTATIHFLYINRSVILPPGFLAGGGGGWKGGKPKPPTDLSKERYQIYKSLKINLSTPSAGIITLGSVTYYLAK
jgi:hypothetical protein